MYDDVKVVVVGSDMQKSGVLTIGYRIYLGEEVAEKLLGLVLVEALHGLKKLLLSCFSHL